jgi:hypothetical protein
MLISLLVDIISKFDDILIDFPFNNSFNIYFQFFIIDDIGFIGFIGTFFLNLISPYTFFSFTNFFFLLTMELLLDNLASVGIFPHFFVITQLFHPFLYLSQHQFDIVSNYHIILMYSPAEYPICYFPGPFFSFVQDIPNKLSNLFLIN